MRNLRIEQYKERRIIAGCMRLYTVDEAAVRDFYNTSRQAGFFTGSFLGNEEYAELNAALEALADKYGVTKDSIAYSWITTHPAAMQVVTGTTKGERVASAVAGSKIKLERHEWWSLFHAAGHYVP